MACDLVTSLGTGNNYDFLQISSLLRYVLFNVISILDSVLAKAKKNNICVSENIFKKIGPAGRKIFFFLSFFFFSEQVTSWSVER